MGKKIRKWLSIALAVVMMASALPLIAGALAPSAGGSSEPTTQATGQAPLKVEIKSDKDSYILLGKMAFTATITNTSNDQIRTVMHQNFAQHYRDSIRGGSIKLICIYAFI